MTTPWEFSSADLLGLRQQLADWRRRQSGRPWLPSAVWEAAATARFIELKCSPPVDSAPPAVGCTSGRLLLYGVEVEVLRVADSLPAPHFRLVSTPKDYVAAAHNAASELSEAKSL